MSVSRKQELFIQGILDGKTQTQAYIDAGYTSNPESARRGASRMLTFDDIKGVLQERRNELKSLAMIKLHAAVHVAIDELARLMESGTNSEMIRLRAIQTILDFTLGKPQPVHHSSRNAPEGERIRVISQTIESGKSGDLCQIAAK